MAGTASGGFTLARYTTTGSLDATFGSGGGVTTDFGTDDEGNSVALQPDGKILVAGFSDHNFALARYTATGSLDATFGSGGKITTDIGGGDDEGYSVAIQPNGKILVAGYSYNGNDGDFALARYNGGSTTGINTLGEHILKVEIFPNPNEGEFQVISKQYPVTGLEVYNVTGEKVFESTINHQSTTINLNAPNGIYFLIIKTGQGTVNKKIIINR